MENLSTIQKTAPSSKALFQILRKTWYLSHLLHQMSLLNLKSHSAMNLKLWNYKSCFEFSETSPEIILNILKDLNLSKAADSDKLSGKFLKDGTDILARPISHKLNFFPRSPKIAKVKPLFKKGSETDPKNYFPISPLPILSKIIKRIIHDQTQDFNLVSKKTIPLTLFLDI